MSNKIANLQAQKINIELAEEECPNIEMSEEDVRLERMKLGDEWMLSADQNRMGCSPSSAISSARTANTERSPSWKSEETTLEIQNKHLKEWYGEEIMEHLLELEGRVNTKGHLERHGISPDLRGKMVDWMIEVMKKSLCSEETLFLAVRNMDRFFRYFKKDCSSGDLHVIGVAAMFLSSKYQEIDPLQLDFVIKRVTHGKIGAAQIKYIEQLMMGALLYWIGAPTELLFLDSFYNILALSTEDKLTYELAKYIGKMNLIDYECCGVPTNLLAAASLYTAVSLTQQQPLINIHTLAQLSKSTSTDILKQSQKILLNLKDFQTRFPGIKKLHLNSPQNVVNFIEQM